MFSALPRAIGAGAIVVGSAVLITWVFNLPGLSRIHPLLGGMNSHSAFCFVLTGTALLLVVSQHTTKWHLRMARFCATALVVVCLLTLGESYGWSMGIQHLFQGSLADLFPGRMPTATTLAFLALGLSLLLLDVEFRQWAPAEFLSFAAILVSLLALIAFWFAFVSFFPLPNRRPLAFHTVFLLFACSVAILHVRPGRALMRLATSPSVAGVLVRRLLPAAVGIPVVAGWLVLEGQRGGLYPAVLTFSYYALSIVVVFGTLVWTTAMSVDRIDSQRLQAEAQVRRMNADLEQRVVERTSQLEQVNRELEAFSYSVSHDLRAPLRAIDGFSAMLQRDGSSALESSREHYIQRIRAASSRMTLLIDDLLRLSKITRNPIRRVRVDVGALSCDIIGELRRSEPGYEISFDVEPNLHADADPTLLRIVLDNLLRNAWKFTHKTETPRIHVGRVDRKGRDAFFVRDNGAGFDMAFVPKLFGAFQRLHSEAEFEGTGIGLATVQRIVHRHGGEVWAEGAVGQGATFFFSV